MKKYCLYFYLLISFIFLHGTTYTVDDDGSADFNTIQEAVDSAKSGDTVFVYSGTYNETVNILEKDSLALIGENQDNCIITADYHGIWFGWGNTLSNFTLNGCDPGVEIVPQGYGSIENVLIEDCFIGIDFYYGYSIVIKNCVLRNNSYGIYIYNDGNSNDSDSTLIIYNSIKNNGCGIFYFPQYIISTYPPLDTFLMHINARQNWWGSADSLEIENSIYHQNDHPRSIAEINYSDWLTEPLEIFPDTIPFISGIHYNNIDSNSDYNIYGVPLPEGNSIEDEKNTINNSFLLISTYPNPFNNQLIIKYKINSKFPVHLNIYDILGNQVFIKIFILSENMLNHITIDATLWSSGLYFIIMKNNYRSQMKKIVLIK